MGAIQKGSPQLPSTVITHFHIFHNGTNSRIPSHLQEWTSFMNNPMGKVQRCRPEVTLFFCNIAVVIAAARYEQPHEYVVPFCYCSSIILCDNTYKHCLHYTDYTRYRHEQHGYDADWIARCLRTDCTGKCLNK